jgi:uncharacterized protein (DUF362 family)
MDRRTFFKKGIGASVAVSSYFAFGGRNNLFAFPPSAYDLVAVKGGEPDVMFDRGIEALGGMKAFVKKGQKVVVKPNIGWDVPPERAGNTNPKLVSRIISHCLNAGAKEVYVVDHTCDEWTRCYKNSGIEKAVKDAGGKIAPGGSESYYQEVSIPKGKSLTKAKEHELILGADVFINVPVLKNHSGTSLTISMKNLMGNVWDRRYWHRTDLHQCIADFATYRKPDLNVVDAYNVMKDNGPRGVSVEDVLTMKAQIISTDIVAADSAAAKLFGVKPEDVDHIKIASEMKVGRMDLDKLNIKRITV